MRLSSLFSHLAIVCALSGLARTSFALPLTLGGEFELTSKDLIKNGGNDTAARSGLEADAAKVFFERVKEKCPDCVISEVFGKRGTEKRVHFDGWYFQISYDPSCVEILTKPATTQELKGLAPKINRLIFQTAKEVGLTTSYKTGAGHFNFGAKSAFGESAEEFLQFYNDFANHPTLAQGAWGEDAGNAPGLNDLKPEQRDAYMKLLAQAREGKIDSLVSAATRIQNQVYTWTPFETGEGHYQAFGVRKIKREMMSSGDQPAEIRSMFPQKSIYEFIKIGEIIEARIAFLQKEKPPLVYLNMTDQNPTFQYIVDNYYKYLTEAGLDWKKYKFTMHPSLKNYQPGDFVRGNVTWTPEYAESIRKFFPYVKISAWTRDRMRQAFTDPRHANEWITKKTFGDLIRSLDRNSITHEVELEFLNSVIESPTWKGTTQADYYRRLIRERLINESRVPRSQEAIAPCLVEDIELQLYHF